MSDGLADSVIARIVRQRDLIQAMDEHCKSISVRVTCRDGSVSVEVDGLGTMTGLWLRDNAYRNGADTLAALIVDTAQEAASVALERQKYLLEQFTERLSELQRTPLTRRDGTVVRPDPPPRREP
jgi:DNA-binding protein YbaB